MTDAGVRQEIDELRRQLAEAGRVVDALVEGRLDPASAAASPAVLLAAKEQVRRSEQLAQAVFESALDAMLLHAPDGRLTDANPAACELFGMAKRDLIGARMADFAAPGFDVPSMGRTLERQGRLRGEFPLLRRDGQRRDLEYAAVADVVPGVHLTVLRDVTERRSAEEALKESAGAISQRERHFRALIEKRADAIALVSAERLVLYASPAVKRLLGHDPAELVGEPELDFVHPDDEERCSTLFDQVLATPQMTASIEFRARHADGGWRWAEATATNLIDDPAVRAVVLDFRDIESRKRTEEALKRVEEQLRHAQKMEAIGILAGGIAHDFNNLLSVILSYAELIVEELPPDSAMLADVEEVRRAAERAVDLTRQLLAFSRKQLLEPRVLDLNKTVSGMEKMLRRVLGEKIELTLLLGPGIGRVYADPGQIEQVIMNLVVNAHDAMPNGGSLTIETANVYLDDEWKATHIGASTGWHVVLSVADTGVGMNEATLARIFEPFFTTKERGKGTGLGLSTVLGIVEQSGGHATVESTPGKGTTFFIYVPHNNDAVHTLVPPSFRPTANVSGTETILLVEDEEQVRGLIRNILRRAGYTVIEAQNAGEAFLACEQHAGPIHLLLTDVVMPRMSGRQLAERLSPARPEMKVLYMSGYTDDATVREGLLDTALPFLHKPVTPQTLLRKVRDALGEPRSNEG